MLYLLRMTHSSRTTKSQHGNVLFLILIAVALFAALSYAVTQSTRGGGDADEDKLALEANIITQYMNSIRVTILRMNAIGGVNDIEFNFHVSGDHTNPFASNCDRDDCMLFSINGGGLTYQAPQTEWLDSSQSGNARYGEYTFLSGLVDGVGDQARDELIMWIPYVQDSLCSAYNKANDIDNSIPVDNPPLNFNSLGLFSGSYPDTTTGQPIIDDAGGLLTGQITGCIQRTDGTYNAIYYVLLSR